MTGAIAQAAPRSPGRTSQGPLVAAETDVHFSLGDGSELVGQRLDDPASLLGAQAARVRKAILDELEIDAGPVPVHVVRNTELPALHRAVGGALGGGWELSGFAYGGHVFVKRGLVSVPDSVLVHELLHILSARFTAEAQVRGCRNLIEGIDHYFTLRLMEHQLHAVQKNHTYIGFTEFAELLADVVGGDALRAAFFELGFAPLARAFDGRRGRGALLRACGALDRKDFSHALEIAAGSR
jgi:hypothetical protein